MVKTGLKRTTVTIEGKGTLVLLEVPTLSELDSDINRGEADVLYHRSRDRNSETYTFVGLPEEVSKEEVAYSLGATTYFGTVEGKDYIKVYLD